ncbi:adenylyl-sulfate kinase [Haloglycomyces albus]|uniref:adenylyl-sulfate kinase n=1 Tax=Haloglycomyces albus TaxID=526067 RepID=UPI00046D25CD|nr:adenylyl-sulfate kinase [Haloglycomyces albus]
MSDWPADADAYVPSYTPNAVELADVELILTGAYRPLDGFMSVAEARSVLDNGTLLDGRSWPVPVTLDVPSRIADELEEQPESARFVELTDPEGAPVATLHVTDADGLGTEKVRLGGRLRRSGDGSHGVFTAYRNTPEQAKETYSSSRVLAAIVDKPLHRPDLAQLARATRQLGAHLLLIVPTASDMAGSPELPLSTATVMRTVLAAQDRLPSATIMALPLARRANPVRDGLLAARVARAYGATHIMSRPDSIGGGAGVRSMLPREIAYDSRDGQWRSIEDIEPPFRKPGLSDVEVADMLARGFELPEWFTPPAVAEELRRACPPRPERGLVVMFTGLSGSGKSTISRGVYESLLEDGNRTVTLLDGDVVRRHLSAGLGFSKADRSMNIRRIGFVAAEIGRHGGIALAAPIAPYDADRLAAQAMAKQAGADFLLIHVNTPLEVCEERDRKGLYAKARAGQLKEFTGISDPYEEPAAADLHIDTSDITVGEATEQVLELMTDGGWLESSGFKLD